MILSNKVYDILKHVVQIALPAIATLYLALAGFWDLPYPEEIAGTIMAVTACLGAILGISSYNYNKEKGVE